MGNNWSAKKPSEKDEEIVEKKRLEIMLEEDNKSVTSELIMEPLEVNTTFAHHVAHDTNPCAILKTKAVRKRVRVSVFCYLFSFTMKLFRHFYFHSSYYSFAPLCVLSSCFDEKSLFLGKTSLRNLHGPLDYFPLVYLTMLVATHLINMSLFILL